ncbi:hypothetical protein E2C01_038823 [Portunus trituberculatus]|uniref:Uncharacterized protein n=1 Tax=Portunus trituberculatus TaxID=210409 RepID=A0A5B7FJJ8_PORTR|nr:hypothetical protein [Portunus trituberculatus]
MPVAREWVRARQTDKIPALLTEETYLKTPIIISIALEKAVVRDKSVSEYGPRFPDVLPGIKTRAAHAHYHS